MELRWTNEATGEEVILFTEYIERLYNSGKKVYAELKDGQIIWLDETDYAARYLLQLEAMFKLMDPKSAVKLGKYVDKEKECD